MAVFTYSALKKDGTTASGELTASDRADAFRRLDRNGLQPLALKQKDAASAPAAEKKNGKEMAPAGDGKKSREDRKPKEERKAKSSALTKPNGKHGSKEADEKTVVSTAPV